MSVFNEVIDIKSIEEFNEIIENYKNKPIVVDFWAPSCAPCKIFHPIFVEAYKKWKDYFIFIRINTEILPEIAEHLDIISIPTIGFIKNQKLIYSHSGALRMNEFDELLELVKFNIENETRNISAIYS